MNHRDDNDYVKYAEKLLNALVIADANVDTTALSDRYRWARTLLIKFINHSVTVLNLFKHGTSHTFESGKPYSIIDFASIDILCRAAIETYLVLNYINVLPKTDEEREFRYLCWSYSSLSWRGKLQPSDPEHLKKVENEKQQAEDILKLIESHKCYQSLNTDNKKKVKKRVTGWVKIAQESGMGDAFAQTIYDFLCKSAHSEALSVWQIQKAKSISEQYELARSAMAKLCIVMSYMIQSYCRIFPKAEEAIRADKELNDLMMYLANASKNFKM